MTEGETVAFNGLLLNVHVYQVPSVVKKVINNADLSGEPSRPCLTFQSETHIHVRKKHIMKSQPLADRNMGGVAVGCSASESQVQAFLFRHVCRHHSVWTCFLQLVIQTHPNEHMASLALHMGMNFLTGWVPLAFWKCHRSHTSHFPWHMKVWWLWAQQDTALKEEEQFLEFILWDLPARKPAGSDSFSLFARESKYIPTHSGLILKNPCGCGCVTFACCSNEVIVES